MRRYMYDEYPNVKGQIVEWGGGGYEQKGNVNIKQEQAIHIHIHVHINIESGTPIQELAERPEMSWLGKLLDKVMLKSQGNTEPSPSTKQVLPAENFARILEVTTKELSHAKEKT